MTKNAPSGAARPAVDFDVAMEVASHEALIRQTYEDSVSVLTWCVGMTNATGLAGERYIGKPTRLQHCVNVFAWEKVPDKTEKTTIVTGDTVAMG